MVRKYGEADPEFAAQRFAMLVSLGVGLVLFVLKLAAYLITGSAAILSDVAESVVHIPAVGFAGYCLWLSQCPPDKGHPYGHERVTYFSAGLEGALIAGAAVYILVESMRRLIQGSHLESLETGNLLIAAAGVVNGLLGWYLVRTGKQKHSLILVADGKHVLSDSYTSVGVVIGLLLVSWTGLTWLDSVFAIAVAGNILFAGWHLVREAILGLMDELDPELDKAIRMILRDAEDKCLCFFHELRIRSTGRTVWVEVHMLFPHEETIRNAHRVATRIEHDINDAVGGWAIVTTHMEPWDTHEEEHDLFPEHPGHRRK